MLRLVEIELRRHPQRSPVAAGCGKPSPRGFVTRARLQPGRKSAKKDGVLTMARRIPPRKYPFVDSPNIA
jgi:hypothetical protein